MRWAASRAAGEVEGASGRIWREAAGVMDQSEVMGGRRRDEDADRRVVNPQPRGACYDFPLPTVCVSHEERSKTPADPP